MSYSPSQRLDKAFAIFAGLDFSHQGAGFAPERVDIDVMTGPEEPARPT